MIMPCASSSQGPLTTPRQIMLTPGVQLATLDRLCVTPRPSRGGRIARRVG